MPEAVAPWRENKRPEHSAYGKFARVGACNSLVQSSIWFLILGELATYAENGGFKYLVQQI
jgi:hypothetical protein